MNKVLAEIIAGVIPHKMTRNRWRGILRYGLCKALRLKHDLKHNNKVAEHYLALCAIAKNQWLNHCRAANREIPIDETAAPEAGAELSLEEKVIEKDTAMQVHWILHHLPEPYKEVFSLRVFGQLSFQEIAHLFGKTESWARVTHHRARKMINDKMRKGEPNG